MQCTFTIQEGTSLETIMAFHDWLGAIINAPSVQEDVKQWEGGFVQLYEGLNVDLFPPRPRDPEGGDLTMIVGTSQQGTGFGFSEDFILGDHEGRPILISSEEWG